MTPQYDPQEPRSQGRVDLHARMRTVTAVVVIALALISFAVSAVALTGLARDHGLSGWLAWTLAVVADGLAIAGGLMVVSRTLDGDSTKYGWFLIVLGASASVAGNVAHAPGDDLIAQVIAGGYPLAMLAAFEAYLSELKRTAGHTPLPDAPTLEVAVAERVAAALPGLAEDLRAQVDAALDAQRVQLAEQLASTQADPAELARQVDTRVDVSTRQQLAGMLPKVVSDQVDTLRVRLERQLASSAQQVDTRVDAAVREQLRAALPSVAQQVSGQLAAELNALRGEVAQASTTVARIDNRRRELRGRTSSDRGDADLTAALDAAYHTNPNPDAWSKRSLATAAGCSPSKAQSYLKDKRTEADAHPDTSTGMSTEDLGEAAS